LLSANLLTKMHVLILLMIALSTLKADFPVIIWGQDCPDVNGAPDFNLTDYLGQWYQLAALPFVFVNTATTCVWAKYAMLPNGNIAVNNTYVKDGKRSGITGEAAPIANTTSGELDVEFFRSPSPTRDANYIVLNTDYSDFSYVWSCTSFYFGHSPKLWLLNRRYNYTLPYVKEQAKNALEILKAFGYDTKSSDEVWRSLLATNQTNCDYDNGKRAFKA